MFYVFSFVFVYLFVWNCSVFQKSWIYIKNTDHEKSFKYLKWYVSIYLLKEINGFWYSASRHDSIEYAQILCAQNISTLFEKRNEKIIVLMHVNVLFL